MAGGFRQRAGASIRLIAPSPIPAHRTGRAGFPHPALRLVSHQTHTADRTMRDSKRSTPSSPKTCGAPNRRVPRVGTLLSCTDTRSGGTCTHWFSVPFVAHPNGQRSPEAAHDRTGGRLVQRVLGNVSTIYKQVYTLPWSRSHWHGWARRLMTSVRFRPRPNEPLGTNWDGPSKA